MENKDMIIKAKRLPSAFYALVSLIFLFASIYCVILPATDTLSGPLALYIKIVYLIIGCIGIAFFGYKATFHVIKLISPPIAIIITDEGLLDHTIPEGGIAYVAWENIAEVKMFGDKKCDWLGISLRTTSKVFMGLTKASRTEISDNIDAGMPAIIIKASQEVEEAAHGEKQFDEPKADTTVRSEEKKSKITFEIIDEPEIEEETVETAMQPKVKNGERFFEISRRPKKKSEVVKEEENIDDILSALSAGRKKDGE